MRGLSGVGGCSGRAIKPIPISWMGGIETRRDAAEFLLLGANYVQITPAVMQYGACIIDDLTNGLHRYLREKALPCLWALQGSVLRMWRNWARSTAAPSFCRVLIAKVLGLRALLPHVRADLPCQGNQPVWEKSRPVNLIRRGRRRWKLPCCVIAYFPPKRLPSKSVTVLPLREDSRPSASPFSTFKACFLWSLSALR